MTSECFMRPGKLLWSFVWAHAMAKLLHFSLILVQLLMVCCLRMARAQKWPGGTPLWRWECWACSRSCDRQRWPVSGERSCSSPSDQRAGCARTTGRPRLCMVVNASRHLVAAALPGHFCHAVWTLGPCTTALRTLWSQADLGFRGHSSNGSPSCQKPF